MNLAYACLVLLACICFARGQTHDLIKTVECDENGKLTATQSDGTYWNISSSASCQLGTNNNSIPIENPDNKLVFSGCPMGNNVVFTATHNNTITDGKVVTTADQDELSVTLTCDAIQSNKDLTASLGGLTFIGTHSVTPIIKNTTENIKMVMELRSQGGSSSTNSMDLGATYDLLIAGAGKHDTHVTKCTAARSADVTGVQIYPRNDSVAVLSNFTSYSGTNKTIGGKKVNTAATLTGFRLVGSTTVYLTCTITVCADTCAPSSAESSTKVSSSSVSPPGSPSTGSPSTGSPSTGSPSGSPSTGLRLGRSVHRKRSKHPTVVHYAKLKLNVRDNSEKMAENGATGAIPVGNHMMRLIFLITIMKFLF